MTETQILQQAHVIYSGNTTYPTSTEEDYLVRRSFANDAIRVWADKNVKWRELFLNLSSASTGTKTTTAGDSTYAMPDDFMSISSLVEINGVYYTYLENDEVLNALRKNTSDEFFYITGSPTTGYVLNINPAPAESGLTISYSYYKLPTSLSTGSSVPEMSKPYFIIYYVVARLHEQDLRNDLVNFYEDKCNVLMDQMIIENEVPPFKNPFSIEDFGNSVNGDAFGI